MVRLVISILIALLLHVTLGWPWSIGGGIVAGLLSPRGGWWRGALAVGGDWLILIAYNIAVAYAPVSEMHRVAASIAGGIPPWTIPAVSVLAGVALGAGGGLVGASLRPLVTRTFPRDITNNKEH